MSRSLLIVAGVVVLVISGCEGMPDSAEGDVTVQTSALTIDDSTITLANPAAAPARRQQLINFLWGTSGFPTGLPASKTFNVPNPITTVPMTNLARVDHLIVNMSQGMQNELYHFVPQIPNHRLVIVHQGHATTLDNTIISGTIAALVAEGYGVLGAFMPCYNSLGVGPGTSCPVTPHDPAGLYHDDMFAQLQPPAGQGSVYKFFLQHLAVGLNYLQSQNGNDGFPTYSEFDMVGLSGGGFTTTLYAAIDPRVQQSFSSSGSKPLYLQQCANVDALCLDAGGGTHYDVDREQMDASLFQLAGYLDLYALAAAGTGRRHVQAQIRHDGTVFGEEQYHIDRDGNARPSLGAANGLTWNQAVRAYEQKLANFFAGSTDQGWYRFEIDETSSGTHQISTNTRVTTILAELDGDRRPFGAAVATNVYTKGLTETLWDAPPGWSNIGVGMVGVPSDIEFGTSSHVFIRDPSSQLMHLGGSQGHFPSEDNFPGTISSDPAATLTGTRLDVVAVGTDLRLYHWRKTGAGAPTLEQVDGNTEVVGTPVLIASGTSRLDAFVRAADGSIKHFTTTGSGWTTETLPGTFRGFPAVVLSTNDNHLRLYARGTDDQLWEADKALPSGSWGLANISIAAGGGAFLKMYGSPGAGLDQLSGKPFVVTRGFGGTIDKFALGSAWSYSDLGVPAGSSGMTFSPVAVPGGVFTRSIEGHVWLNRFSSNTWTLEGGQIY